MGDISSDVAALVGVGMLATLRDSDSMSIDVRCGNCSTVYVFERDRVPAEGLTVKCGQCQHVFAVTPDGRAQRAESVWRVRQANGSVFTFKELTTLQRWIVERKVSRSDEISKTGKNWKRLGDIAELATFFQVVDRADAPLPPPAPVPVQPAPVVHAPAPMAMSSDGIPLQRAFPDGAGPAGHWDEGPSDKGSSGSWMIGQPPNVTNTGYTMGPEPIPAPRRNTIQPSPFSSPEMELPSAATPSRSDAYDDYDDLDFEDSSGGALKWIVIMVVLLALGTGGFYLARPDMVRSWIDRLTAPDIPPLARGHLNTGYAELFEDSYASIDRAIDNFEKAIALAPEFAEARAGIAEAEIARAEWLARDARRIVDEMGQLEGEAEQAASARVEELRAEVARRAERAFNEAKEAIRLDPDGLASNRSMADYYRFKRAPEQMRSLLDKARVVDPNDAGISYVLGSSVEDEPETTTRAMHYFEAALEREPAMQRARFKVAALLVRQDQLEQARTRLEAILAVVPDHEQAKSLLAKLTPPEPAEETPAPEEKAEEAPEASEPGEEVSFNRLLAQANRLRNADRAERALRLYEKAVEMEPDDPDALTGLGWAYLDLENSAAAIATFKKVLKRIPRFSDAHYGIAEAYRAKGMKRDAVKHYRKYLDILPNGPEAEVARRALEELKQ